jgi:hypothetical protein
MDPSPEQMAIYRAMTPQQRLAEARRMYWAARRLRAAHERQLHPDWSEAQVQERVRQVFLSAGT